MSVQVKFNVQQFSREVDKCSAAARAAIRDQANQSAVNVAVGALKATPPKDIESKRAEIKAYMNHNAGSGHGNSKPTRANLIIQARRAKAGLKGLYGQDMREAAKVLSFHAQKAAGLIKSVFVPIIKALLPLVRNRPSPSVLSGIPKSNGTGLVRFSILGPKTQIVIETSINVHPSQQGKVDSIQRKAMEKAISDEEKSAKRDFEKELQSKLNLFNK